jgi:hypothetical protein
VGELAETMRAHRFCRRRRLASRAPAVSVQVGAWFVAIAQAVAQSAKTVNPDERATIEKLAALFGVTID